MQPDSEWWWSVDLWACSYSDSSTRFPLLAIQCRYLKLDLTASDRRLRSGCMGMGARNGMFTCTPVWNSKLLELSWHQRWCDFVWMISWIATPKFYDSKLVDAYLKLLLFPRFVCVPLACGYQINSNLFGSLYFTQLEREFGSTLKNLMAVIKIQGW